MSILKNFLFILDKSQKIKIFKNDCKVRILKIDRHSNFVRSSKVPNFKMAEISIFDLSFRVKMANSSQFLTKKIRLEMA